MAFVSEYFIYNFLVAVFFVFVCLYLFFTSTFNHWKDRGVPYIKPIPFFGNLKDQIFQKKSQMELIQDFYDGMKNERYFGIFEIKNPVLIIRDPELVEKVLIKDFNHFYNRGISSDEKTDPLTANLVHLEDSKWRNLRYKLTPTFTSGKLKGMFEQVCNCGGGLVKYIEEESKINKAIESKPLLSKFTFEVIASTAFGLQLDKDTDESKNFHRIIKVVFQPSTKQMCRFFMVHMAPKFSRAIGIKHFPQEMEDIVLKLVREVLQYRKDNNVVRNDFLQLMLNLQKQEKEGTLQFHKELNQDSEDSIINQMKHVEAKQEDQSPEKQKLFMTEAVIAAQSFIFLVAGSEPVASTIDFTLFELSQHPKILDRVHEEIDSVLASNNNEWSYQAIKDMVYMEQVIQETLRKYPTTPVLFRICTENYKMPDSDLVIEKGTRILIPTCALHRDPKYHENPEVFDPDRFQDNNFKPSGTYLPFGDGPRICIAMRFAVLEVKVVLARLLAEYKVKLSSKTQLPLVFKKKAFNLVSEHGIYFEFDKRV